MSCNNSYENIFVVVLASAVLPVQVPIIIHSIQHEECEMHLLNIFRKYAILIQTGPYSYTETLQQKHHMAIFPDRIQGVFTDYWKPGFIFSCICHIGEISIFFAIGLGALSG